MTDSVLRVIFKGTDEGLRRMAGGLGESITNVGKIALGIGVGGIAALGAAFSDATELARIQQNAEKQLEAVLESTGNAAGLTADEIKNMASELQTVTNFGDEAIISGQNLLLTFTNIGGDIFPRVTEAMLDVSQAMGQDMKSSAIQLGKALNNPIQGISALADVGVSFTEEQKEMVRTMQEAGDIAGAQAIILGELETQFGGSAQALADPAIQLSNAWGDFKEIVGGAMLSVINPLAQRALPFLSSVMEQAKPLIEGIGNAFSNFITAIASGQNPLDAFGSLIVMVSSWLGLSENQFEAVGEAVFMVIEKIRMIWAEITAFMEPIIQWIQQNVELKDVLIALAIAIGGVVLAAIVSVATALAPIVLTIGLLVGAVALVRTAWEENWGGIQEKTAAFWAWLQPVLQTVVEWLQVNIPIAIEVLRGFWENTLLPAIQAVWTWLSTTLMPFITGVLVPWLQENIPAAIQVLTDFWNNTLMPVLEGVWEFLSVRMMPVWEALADFLSTAFTLALTAITGIWENVLLPAMEKVWDFITNKLGPVFQWLKDSLIDPTSAAFQTLSDMIADLAGWISEVAAGLRDIELPDWMTPGSPTPWEIGLKGVRDQMQALTNQELPQLQANLQGFNQSGTTNQTTSTNNFNWTIQTSDFNPETAGRQANALALGGI